MAGHYILNPPLDEKAADPEVEAGDRWRALQEAAVGVVIGGPSPLSVSGACEMGILLGYARHIIIWGELGGAYAYLPWLRLVPEEEPGAVVEALGEIQSAYEEPLP